VPFVPAAGSQEQYHQVLNKFYHQPQPSQPSVNQQEGHGNCNRTLRLFKTSVSTDNDFIYYTIKDHHQEGITSDPVHHPLRLQQQQERMYIRISSRCSVLKKIRAANTGFSHQHRISSMKSGVGCSGCSVWYTELGRVLPPPVGG
jgi:hypothetical protein